MEIPTVLCKAENSTNAQWRNLRQECERKFVQWSEDQQFSKLCSDAGLKLVERGQFFYSLETEQGQQMQHLYREYTMPGNEKGTRVRRWIRKDTRIGPVLHIKVCYRDEQYSVEVQVPSLFQDDTVSSTAKGEDTASGKPIGKTRPRQKATVTLTSVSIPVLERKWIDIERQRSHVMKCQKQ